MDNNNHLYAKHWHTD